MTFLSIQLSNQRIISSYVTGEYIKKQKQKQKLHFPPNFEMLSGTVI